MRKVTLSLIFIFAAVFNQLAYADNSAPITMLDNIAETTLAKIQENKQKIDRDPGYLHNILRSYVLPHVDFDEMALWIAGKKAWRSASQAERAEFISEFKTMVLRTYSHFLLGIEDEQVTFEPVSDLGGRKRIQVSGKIVRSNGQVIRVDYRLVKKSDRWYIFDMVADGVSLLRGFQAQFSDTIKSKGLSTVIAELKNHNDKRQG